MIDATKFMLHSTETNLNEEEMNVKSLTCLSIIRHRKRILMTQEFSFCQFVCTDEVSSVMKSSLNIVNYALMLPYSRRGFPFQSQFTLVFSDWKVLLCDNNAPDSKKGPVYVHRPLFEDVLSQF
jgi:hypothetical protein